MSEKHERMLRVGLAGVLAMLSDLCALVFLVEKQHLQVALAALLAAGVGAVLSFFLNKYWAFRDFSPIRIAQLSGFATVAVGSALLVAACVQLLCVEIGAPYLLGKAVGAILVFFLWSYPVQARLVFAAQHACR